MFNVKHVVALHCYIQFSYYYLQANVWFLHSEGICISFRCKQSRFNIRVSIMNNETCVDGINMKKKTPSKLCMRIPDIHIKPMQIFTGANFELRYYKQNTACTHTRPCSFSGQSDWRQVWLYSKLL